MPARKRYPELLASTRRFSATTRTNLERSLARVFSRRSGATLALREAVGDATRELRAEGLDSQATIDVLSALVEDAGRSCGADRLSLISGEPQWLAVQAEVVASVKQQLETRDVA